MLARPATAMLREFIKSVIFKAKVFKNHVDESILYTFSFIDIAKCLCSKW
jgi:hypothetical protein